MMKRLELQRRKCQVCRLVRLLLL
uniref:Uncharacterized protein n=1 Tax=Anguilla anguilla TaxID=7936 RepID=A0A0E9TN22_ANGAN